MMRMANPRWDFWHWVPMKKDWEWLGCAIDDPSKEGMDGWLLGLGMIWTQSSIREDRTIGVYDRFAKKWKIYEVGPTGPVLLQS